MKKAETHCHIAPISVCSRLNVQQCVEKYVKCGFDVLTVTNHYNRSYIEHNGIEPQEWRELYLAAYRDAVEEGKKQGIEIFFGTEVTLFAPYNNYYRERYSEEFLKKNYADYLLVGATEKFFLDAPLLFDLDQKELHAVCRDNGVLLIQAHPFRTEQNHSLKDLNELDGLEINGCVGFATAEEEKILKIARENNLIVTCGGDTHYEWHKLRSATFIPDDVHDSVGLAEYLRKVRIPEYSLTEPDPFAPERK